MAPLLIVLGGSSPAQQSQEVPVFRGGVSLVRVDLQVTDPKGRVVPGLGIADFQVFDDDRPQKIVHFGHESEPLDLLLLLDVSGSMHRFLEEMASTARAALQPLASGDRVAVMLFSREAAVREEFTQDFAAVQAGIRRAVDDRTLGSGTAINGALLTAAGYLEKQPVRGRRAILIVTDNTALNYQTPDEAVIRELYRADAVLNTILIGKQVHPDPVKPGRYRNPDFTPPDVFKLTAQTGGEFFEARKFGNSFAEMIGHLRARYALQYDAPSGAPGAFHRIRVELVPGTAARYPGALLRARSGYYATN